MAHDSAEPSGFGAGAVAGGGAIEASIWNALPHFLLLLIFPLIVNAAMQGGWWIGAPFVFFMLAGPLDTALGADERNMDPLKTPERRLFWHNLPVWGWAFLWPATFAFTLWQILVSGHLALWERALMAVVLAGEAQAVFIVGHELVHRRHAWERRLGEFLLASASYPHYATEHVYIHHALVGTPLDVGSAPKGESIWRYFPRELASNLLGAWRVTRERLARRRLPIWHYSNPFWRYGLATCFWYAFIYWMGDWWVLPIFTVLCLGVVFSMKISNYIQHYGLRRIRLPNGKFEKVRPRHSWSADCKFSNWMFYNMQRHPDHHAVASRQYALLQHHGGEESPQLPGSYGKMFNLAVRPKRWFQTMDPLVDEWRARFYPEIDDWSAYDSPVSEARPDAFDAIVEIFGTAPRLAKAIERNPELLDSIRDREFTDLDLPGGFGPNQEFEATARRGLTRLYWTHEFGVAEMKEQIAEAPVQDARDAVDAVRNWSNDKTFQIGMHTLRGNLTPIEAGRALANVGEAAIAVVLSAVEEDFADRRGRPDEGGVATVVLGDLASGEAAPGATLDILFVHDARDARYCEALCHRFQDALRTLSRGSLLFAPLPRGQKGRAVRSVSGFAEHHRSAASASELLELTRAQCVFEAGEAGIEQRFEDARREALTQGANRDALVAELREAGGGTAMAGLAAIDDMPGGLGELERAARLLQLTQAGDSSDDPAPTAAAVFETARVGGSVPDDAAERLTKAARMWRILRGILRLIADEGFTAETAKPTVKDVIAQSCGMDDFDALTAAVRERAANAAAAIDTLSRMSSPSPGSEENPASSRTS